MGKSSDPTIYRAKVPLPDPVPDAPLSTPELEGVRAAMWAYRPGCTTRRLLATVDALAEDRDRLAAEREARIL